MERQFGPTLAFSENLHASKYRLENENFRESVNRVCNVLKDDDEHFAKIRDITLDMRFLFAGRIQAAIGAPKVVTPYNCYVSGTIADSFVDGDGSIMQRATEAAQTMRMGGGIGYDFSTLRPNGDIIRGVMSRTSGPMAFLPVFDAVCKATSSAGNRRGAQMAVIRIDHPDIEAFIHAKQTPGMLEGFNMSIAVTDEFMEHLASGKPFPLKFQGRTYSEVDPQALWDLVMRSTWDWAEPGVLFIDTINRMNNLYYCEDIAATNPCGEQPLPPFGACLLGSINLVKYIKRQMGIGPDSYYFDWNLLEDDLPAIVRAMDNVVDVATYPLVQQKIEAMSKRRMGIGITGFANASEVLGFEYGTDGSIQFLQRVLEEIQFGAYKASAHLAAEKGAFPKFDADLYLAGEFARQLPTEIRDLIRKHGLRNSHLTSIAPTGTISFCADYISSGVEPVFEYEATRLVNMPDGQVQVDVSDYGFREFGVKGKLSSEVTGQEHIHILSAASVLVDSAVSKTCNVDGTMPWEDFKDLYIQAYNLGCKGCTTFNKDGKRMGMMVAKSDKTEGEVACYIDENTGRRECA